MPADKEVDKVANMVADKKNIDWHGVGHGGQHVQSQVYKAWNILKRSVLAEAVWCEVYPTCVSSRPFEFIADKKIKKN